MFEKLCNIFKSLIFISFCVIGRIGSGKIILGNCFVGVDYFMFLMG